VITTLHNQDAISITALCAALGVARSSYYAHCCEKDRAVADRLFDEQIGEIFREHRRRYGSRRIAQELSRRGITCSRHRVRRIMSQRGLKALKTPRRFVPRTSDGGAAAPAPNLLLNREAPTSIDEVWVTDITYIPVAGVPWVYLAMVMDLYSRRIIGWKLGPDLRTGLVIDALAAATSKRRPATGLIAHSDRGSQYGSTAYARRLDGIGAIQSMSRRGNCYDNAFMESCFGTIKDEMLEDGQFDSFEDAHTELFDYIEIYYNRKRIHSSLGGIPPEEFETKQH
jgi:transposase InsO family protein